ncbi:hypothetical protein ACHAXA_011109 [Cyclostephanos tholiformis]|uniref:RING-type domain-containing protein n=1 Tax=Cyclostephanos tholiformis TaxID=382380 RepID=A0ABD3SFG5_9STRA
MSMLLRGYSESKLKSQLKMAMIRLSMGANRKSAMSRQARFDIVKMLEEVPSNEESALIGAEALIRDEDAIEAYEILVLHCELLSERVRLLSNGGTTCPSDLVESVSTLIWASNALDVSELVEVRKQFRCRYGREFVEDAMRNGAGGRARVVNERVVSKFSCVPPSSERVRSTLVAIANERGLTWRPRKTAAAGAAAMPPKSGEMMHGPTKADVAGGRGGDEDVFVAYAPLAPSVGTTTTRATIGREQRRPVLKVDDDIEEEGDIFFVARRYMPHAAVKKSRTPPSAGEGGGDLHDGDDDDDDIDDRGGGRANRGRRHVGTQDDVPPSLHSIQRSSLLANDVPSPTSEEAAAGLSRLRLDETVEPARRGVEEEENLCIVCEDSKKQVILLPCKHMCLCKNCASEHIPDTLTECPMCRAKIEDSMEVYW